MISASPPIRHPCAYGIDMSTHAELIAATHDVEATRQLLGADALVYQPLEALKALYADGSMCYACFDAQYPTSDTRQALCDVAREKKAARRS